MFNYHLFNLECTCGQKATVFKTGITSHFYIYLEWKCAKCRKDMWVIVSFENAMMDAPVHPEATWTPQDLQFLQENGIKGVV